uniref:MULE transposase N-terminal all-beta domain-containing protein n=1 Tax=Noccaea caerulescens TaxID=107243 RepID=A0A1J3G639_NOCCA
MSNNTIIHFKFQDRPYSLLFKTSTEEINMSMLEARICKKVGLDENRMKLKLYYTPLLVGNQEPWIISDDEDLSVYLNSIDNENRRCLLAWFFYSP